MDICGNNDNYFSFFLQWCDRVIKNYKKIIIILFAFLNLLIPLHTNAKSPNLLIKIYTNNTPEELFITLDKYYKNLSNEIPYHFLITCDRDNLTMNCPETIKKLTKLPNLTIQFNNSKTISEAFNSGINKFINWFDVLLVITDGVEPIINHYDKIIVDTMLDQSPDYEDVLNFQTDSIESINQAPIIGKKFYNRFGYIYHPSYKSSCFDHELTYVSRILGKEIIIKQSLLSKPISPLEQNREDKEHFDKRRLNTFDLDEITLQNIFTKDWSILICTLPEREKQYSQLYNKLSKQIQENNLQDKIEVLSFKDNREFTVGYKRNELVKKSMGMYINFIDDDDDIHDNYIKMIYEKLKNKPDCVSLSGIITFNGNYPASFIHSIKYNSYFQKDGTYYRPPNHLNTIKRSVGSQFLFPNICISEDTNWAMQIANTGLLKKEESITIPYYFYQYVEKLVSNE